MESAQNNSQNIQYAIVIGETETLFEQAHSLKSASANLGARALADTCQVLENAGKNHDIDLAKQYLAFFKTQFHQTINALQDELGKGTSSIILPEIEFSSAKENAICSAHILVVDDDPGFHLITSEHLIKSGFSISKAYSGNEALEQMELQKPDLIILDAIMEDLDGFETCRAIRDNSMLCNIPVIISTGLDDIESINRAFNVGASDFIIKPINYTLLVHHINFLLRTRQNTIELQNSKFQLSLSQRAGMVGSWSWFVASNEFVMSKYMANLCGIGPELFKGSLSDFIALISPEDRTRVKNSIYSTLNNIDRDEPQVEFNLIGCNNYSAIVRQETSVMEEEDGGKVVTGTVRNITKQKESEDMVYHLSFFDDLTELPSRLQYNVYIEQLIRSYQESHESFALLCLNLDEFRYINHCFGNLIGDELLKSIASRLKSIIGSTGFVARIGGDEFGILIESVSKEMNAIQVAEKCLRYINYPLILNASPISPRMSIGLSFYPADGISANDLIKAADTAMYVAKDAGKQCYACYKPEMTTQALERFRGEQLLREAVEKKQFILYYQPQINLLTGRIKGFEALLRWQHPEKGIIGPDHFIHLAESLGLIQEIGNWVMDTSCQQMMQWHHDGMPLLQMSVNISAIHFNDPGLLQNIKDVLISSRLPAQYLTLEITESAVQETSNIELFTKIKALGVSISIDDFGTGYSSFASLKELPIDCLKIDKSFVQDVLYNEQTPKILSAIINLSNAMEFGLIAEGVETVEQALVISGLGCHVIQGYYFSKPVPENEVIALTEEQYSLNVE